MITDIYRSSLETLTNALVHFPYPIATFLFEADTLNLLATSNLEKEIDKKDLPQQLNVKSDQLIEKLIPAGKIFSVNSKTAPVPELFEIASILGFIKVSFLRVLSDDNICGLVMVGCKEGQSLTKKALQPYSNVVNLANLIFEQSVIAKQSGDQATVPESSTLISQEIAASGNLEDIFSIVHERIKQTIGDYSLIIAFYDEKTTSISIPYFHGVEENKPIDSIQAGEGLISNLIRTKIPIMLLKDVSKKFESLGVKTQEKPAKSWLGVPLLVNDEAIGGIIIQDIENENAFNDSDLETLTALAQHASGFIFSTITVNDIRRRLFQLQSVSEVARDISSALNLDELLIKAINLIQERFNFYHAAIFIIDSAKENVVVREATGEAGAHMKRTGHKLAVGSKSGIGYVARQGESLVINDTTKDATHLPYPMLPDTRAEAAIPIVIGDQVFGILDVQSTTPYSFTPNDVEILQILADQLSIAANNAELFAETQEHLSQHRLLHHITTSAASGATLDEALTTAVEGLQVTLGGDRVSILISDSDRKNLIVTNWVGYSGAAEKLSIPFGSGITGWVAAHRKPLRINDTEQDARYIQISSNTRSELALPLVFRNDVLGVLNVESEQVAAYNENDEEMLGTLAGSLAAIIANARLVEKIRKQAERERQLYEISSKIRRSSDMQTILTTTINELSLATGARRAQISVGFPEGDTDSLPDTDVDTTPNREE